MEIFSSTGDFMGRKETRIPATNGYSFAFHGSFTAKDKAEAKAKRRGGFFISRVPRGTKRRRYIVMTEKVPF